MSGRKNFQEASPHRGVARLKAEPGLITASDLLGFAETLLRDAFPGADITGAALQVLDRGSSTKVSGEAQCLSHGTNPVWRVSIADDTGTPLAEVLMTLSQDRSVEGLVPLDLKRTADADDRRTRIALAARDVFAEKGYAAATMREIAAVADMHVPTMYQYFRSKEEILELVYDWTIDQAVTGMRSVLDATGPEDRRMDDIVRRLHAVNEELRRGTLVMNRETRSLGRSARDRVLGRYDEMMQRVAAVIADGQEAGIFRPMDPRLAAVFIDALADIWVLRPFAVGHADEETYVAELAAFVRGGLSSATANNPETPG